MRVFVTVGNPTEPFDRLVRWFDEAVAGLPLGIPIEGICQFGSCGAQSVCLEAHQVLTRTQFDEELRRADVVVCHAGVGTLFSAMRAGHVPLVVPRRAALGEHINDHQCEIVGALGAEGRVVAVGSASDLCEWLGRFARGETRARSPEVREESLHLDAIGRAVAAGRIGFPGRVRRAMLKIVAAGAPALEKLLIQGGPRARSGAD